MTLEPAVLLERRGLLAVVTLNRPENRNSMTDEVLEGLQACVRELRADAEVRCVVITGTGRSFCAGADFNSQVQRGGKERLPHERSFSMYAPFLEVLELEVPTIAAMNGHAIGGGLGLALVCDLRVASCEAKYGANFVRLGLAPGMATTYLLPRLVGMPRALELLLTGRIVTGTEAAALGIVNRAVAPEQVLDESLALAEEIASNAPIAVQLTKEALYRHSAWDPVSAARFEAHLQSRTLETRDSREGIRALIEKRSPTFRGE